MKIALALVLLLSTTGLAQAYCVSAPDNASTSYVQNGVKHSVCLNTELSQQVRSRNQLTQVQTSVDQLQRDMQRRQVLLQQQLQLATPRVSPSFP